MPPRDDVWYTAMDVTLIYAVCWAVTRVVLAISDRSMY